MQKRKGPGMKDSYHLYHLYTRLRSVCEGPSRSRDGSPESQCPFVHVDFASYHVPRVYFGHALPRRELASTIVQNTVVRSPHPQRLAGIVATAVRGLRGDAKHGALVTAWVRAGPTWKTENTGKLVKNYPTRRRHKTPPISNNARSVEQHQHTWLIEIPHTDQQGA